MHTSLQLAALAATFSSALAAFQGFNYGSAHTDQSPKFKSDFEMEFKAARNLAGAPPTPFTSARLYTTIQAGTANEPISAIPAAIDTKTSLLLGLWCSAGEEVFKNELQALKSAIDKYGDEFAYLVAGISVGSEDLYRISPTGIKNKENPGAEPLVIAGYIQRVRDTIANTALAGAQVGHVDTWTAWVNSSNQAVIDACDWIGVDAYPYFQETQVNTISNSKSLFNAAFSATKAAVSGKPVWVTETGFPVSGKTVGQAIPSVSNSKTYWDEVGCPLFGNTNVWWYTLVDAAPATPNPSFGIIPSVLTNVPLFDISCKNVDASGSPSSSLVGSSTLGTPAGAGSAGNGGSKTDSGSNSTLLPPAGTPRPSTTPDTNPNGAATVAGSIVAAAAAMLVVMAIV